MEFIPVFIILFISFLLIYRWKIFRISGINQHWIAIAFSAKIFAALVMLFIFSNESRQKSDIFRFYDDAKIINSEISQNPKIYLKIITGFGDKDTEYQNIINKTNNWDAGATPKLISNNKFIIRYLSLVRLISFRSYYGSLAITLFFSFIGLFLIFKIFSFYLIEKKWILFFIVFFTPSLLFWTSGLLKESLIILLIGIILNCLYFAQKKKKPILRLIIILISLAMLFELRGATSAILLVSLIPFLWNIFKPKWKPFTAYFIMIFILMSIASESDNFYQKGGWQYIAERRQEYVNQAINDNSESLFSTAIPKADSWSMIKEMPKSLINILFRPFPQDIHNVNSLIAFLENLLLFGIILLTPFYIKKPIENLNLFYFLLCFSILFFLLIGLTIPISGAISRYRTIPLLFLEIAILMIFDIEKFKSLISRIKI